MSRRGPALRDRLRLVYLSLRMVAGRRFWAVPVLVLLWPGFQLLRLLMGWRPDAFVPEEVQGILVGVPLTVLGIGLGVRVIAGEIDRRTLEIAYTVPGGAQRVWTAKLAGAFALLVAVEASLALAAFVFFTEFPLGALYGALQAATFYLVLGMALAALFKSEATGALFTVGVLLLNGVLTAFGQFQPRLSPFFNPETLQNAEPADLLAWTTQNRIGFLLIIAAVTALGFGRAERREKLLAG